MMLLLLRDAHDDDDDDDDDDGDDDDDDDDDDPDDDDDDDDGDDDGELWWMKEWCDHGDSIARYCYHYCYKPTITSITVYYDDNAQSRVRHLGAPSLVILGWSGLIVRCLPLMLL